jgi:DNA repair protein SbcC/Rad50
VKILAIRGCNLASLAGEFEIDLSRAPFADAGVFAIVGNTGAGKSTLLDALCVALFDRTPRLTNHSRVVVGRGDDDPGALGAQDARTLLRRGAAAGWAEVDFEGGDTRRYRARWSVRRARGRSDGALQDQQLTLTALAAGEKLGGTKTETLRAIATRLGLSFDQFRRSALLAQGEFAAFLRADGKDRSELLERMTGTEIYSRLSIAAHVKAALAEQRLRDGHAVAHAIAVLDPDARAAAEVERATAEDARAAARARLAAAQGAARWLAESEQRVAAHAAAVAEHEAAVAAAGPERAELARQLRAEKLRPVHAEVARVESALASALRDRDTIAAATKAARARREELDHHRGELAQLQAPIRAARIAARLPEIVMAPRTDALAVAAGRRAAPSTLADTGDASGDAWGHVPSRFADPRGARAPLVRASDPALAHVARGDAPWITRRAALAPELAAWSELDARFAEHAAVGEALAVLDRDLTEAVAAERAQASARMAVAAEQAAALARLGDAQRKVQHYQQRRGLSLDAARRLEDEARIHVAEIERLVAIAAAARQVVHDRGELDRELARVEEAAAVDLRLRDEAEGARSLAAVLRDDRARVLDELRRAAGYEHARAELIAGEPCPLCGATEHPWSTRGAFDELIASARTNLAEAAARLDAAVATLAAVAARGTQRDQDRARLAELAERGAGALEAWRAHLAGLGELVLEEDPATPGAQRLADDRDAAARRRLDQARDTRRQTEAATKAAGDAQAEVQLWQAQVDQLAARLAEIDRALAEHAAAAERLRGERGGRQERRAELEGLLRAAIDRWRRLGEHDGSRGVPDLVALGSGVSLASARAVLAELVGAWAARVDRVAAADALLAAELAEVDRELREAEHASVELGARLAEIAQRLTTLTAEAAAARHRFDGARVAAELEPDELERVLGQPSREAELAARIAELERAVERTRAIAVERAQQAGEHARQRPDDARALADAGQLDVLVRAADEADHHAARLLAALAADADARLRREAAFAQVSALEASVEADRILGRVIGSHDGKLLRSFAQSLTLDGLLAVANAHLDELAPRYQLERVPRHDLELQVIDRDLGGEVRSIQSLSGGESFLVSLALALGLSSMSAQDVRVRTLLIDEGFGTLDPATLDTALSVLDTLQATGRQVGVISHVPALVDRVGAHVRVVQRGGGRSEVVIPGPR